MTGTIKEADMFTVTVEDKDGVKHMFLSDSIVKAMERADAEFPGHKGISVVKRDATFTFKRTRP